MALAGETALPSGRRTDPSEDAGPKRGQLGLWRYGFATVVVLLAAALQLLLVPLVPEAPQLLFYPAVFAVARVCGRGPGLLATALSAMLMAVLFLPPRGALAVELPRDVLTLAIFSAVSVTMTLVLARLRELLERERRSSEKANRAKAATEATWSMIAHDLRTPLSTIALGSAEVARSARTDAAHVERAAALIERSSQRAAELISDALDAMQLGEGTLSVTPLPTDLGELLTAAVDAVSLLATRATVTVEVDVRATGALLCDAPRIKQVLSNLLVNAVRFTPKGGKVLVSATDRDGRICLAVADSGPGIAPEQRAAIFSKYWTTSRGGRGLGLWIARTIVEAHGSALELGPGIAADDGSARGAAFTFCLPRVVTPTPAPADRSAPPAPA